MDFGLNEQQEMLQKSARDFLGNEYSDVLLKQMAQDAKGYTPELWNKMAELGWMALSIPEAYGGIGDFIDLILVIQEMGRIGLISPFFSSVVLGAAAIIETGSEEQKQKYLPAIAEGKTVFTLALNENSARFSPEMIETKAVAQGDGYVINGIKMFVPDAGSADQIICAVRTGDSGRATTEITLFIVDGGLPGVKITPLDTIGPDKLYEVILDGVTVSRDQILGSLNEGWKPLKSVQDRAAVATCALMVGGSERVLDLSVNYAKERMAFGHPIGAYQSIQHRCADMLIDVSSARYVTYQAAWYLSEGLPADKEVAIAKSWVGQAYRRVVTSAHQVHGAIGFTEDHVLHWYTKRARAQDVAFGDVNYHLKKLASLAGQ